MTVVNQVDAYFQIHHYFFTFFAWILLFSMSQAIIAWSLIIIGLYLLCGYLLRQCFLNFKLDHHPFCFWLFWFALGFQIPLVFSLERGNNDVIILILSILCLYAFTQNRWREAGFLQILSVGLKLYPIFISIPLVAYFWKQKPFKAFFTAGLISGTALFFILWDQHIYYIINVLPGYASLRSFLPTENFEHAIAGGDYGIPYLGNLLSASLLIVCLWLCRRKQMHLSPILYAFAICTYFANVSFDYNLVTTLPLFIYLILIALNETKQNDRKNLKLPLFLFTGIFIFFILIHFKALYPTQLKYLLMWGWLMTIGLWLGKTDQLPTHQLNTET